MNSSWAVGDILAIAFVSVRDNTIYAENRKHISLKVVVSSKKTIF